MEVEKGQVGMWLGFGKGVWGDIYSRGKFLDTVYTPTERIASLLLD